MKRRIIKIGVIACLSLIISFLPVLAQTGSWKAYMAYYEPQQIIKGGHRLYVRASNNLYAYNLNDQSITTYDKIRQLNDTKINIIAWNPTVKKLLICYSNYNIDILNQNDEAFNISSYYNKTTTLDKTINSIFIYEQYAYIATAFGIVKMDMKREEISESYNLKNNILDVDISEDSIYAKYQNNGATYYLRANKSSNLIDPANWENTDSCPANLFVRTNTDWDEYIETVKTLKPGGPRYNNFGGMRFKHGQLYTVGGGYSCMAELNLPGMIQILKDEEWSFLGDSVAIQTGHWFTDVDDIDADPNNPTHIFASGKTGLYEFLNGEFVGEYNIENSPLTSALGNEHSAAKNYTLVEGICFDKNSNLWVANAGSQKNTLLKLNKDKTWKTFFPQELMMTETIGLYGLQKLIIDSRNYLWFINYHWTHPGIFCFDTQTETIIHKYVDVLINQDGISYEQFYPTKVEEDLNNNIWITTTKGVFTVENNQISNGNDNEVTQIKIPRNDGSDLADYLLNGAATSAMIIDAAGRKWIGTQNTGIYLISADNMTEIHHFTVDNSDILSNNIQSLAINNETGELFIGTDAGLCSYMSDATEVASSLEKNNVYAFPNPVPAGYNGLITIRGLTFDADVKILTADGRLVAQGRSNGGTFTWNGCDLSGHHVASGVYMIAVATSEGESGIVAKVAIIN